MAFTEPTTTEDFVRNWPYRFQRADLNDPSEGFGYDFGYTFGMLDADPLWDLLTSIAREVNYIDNRINEINEQRFLETATGRELAKLAAEVVLTKMDGETEEQFRFRTQIARSASSSNGNAEDIRAVLETAFGQENLSSISVQNVSGKPVTQFSIDSALINDIPMTETEFEAELRRAWPASHDIEVVTSDTFVFGQSGSQGLGAALS